MTSDHCSQIDLHEYIHSFVVAGESGELTDDRWTDFERLLRESDDACRLYAEYMDVSIFLPLILDTVPEEESPSSDVFSSEQQEPIAPPRFPVLSTTLLHGQVGYFSSDWPVAYLIATVIFGIGALIGSITYVSHPVQVAEQSPRGTKEYLAPVPQMEFVGRITGMVDCQWADPTTEAIHGANVPLGRKYALASGLMEITYDTGAKVVLQGPVTYEVESKDGGFLSLGKLTARVDRAKPQAANPQSPIPNPSLSTLHSPLFTIKTPTAIVTDLGTEFGVEVDKRGNTASHVYRGSVTLQVTSSDGKTEGVARVLHENESARVEDHDSQGGGNRITMLGSSAKPTDFVREIPKRTVKMFDLVDVVAGGNGFSGRRGAGIDPANGQMVDSYKELWPAGDGKYHRVEGTPLIDGVFMPAGGKKSVQLDSAGHTFAEFVNSENLTPGYLWAGGASMSMVSATLDGVDYASAGHGALFLHANKGITFDLDAIRRANPGYKLLRFLAVPGNTENLFEKGEAPSACADIWVFVDGRNRFKRREINGYSGAYPIAISIEDKERFLTLVATDGGNGTGGDWTMFGDPRLEMIGDGSSTAELRAATPENQPGRVEQSSPRGESSSP